jgi:alpha-tubulin suppressor-like RCC1 family protein
MALSLDLSTSSALLAMSALDGILDFEGMAAADKARLAELCRRLLPRLDSEVAAAVTAAAVAVESLLIASLRQDVGEHIFKFLASRDTGRLERAFTRELVFVKVGGGEALLRLVAARRHTEAAKRGTTLAPLGEARGGRKTWATELLWINVVVARSRVARAHTMISAGDEHSLVTSGREEGVWSFGTGYGVVSGANLPWHLPVLVPRLIEVLNHVVVTSVAAGCQHSMLQTCGGAVFTWGRGYHGRLGHGNTANQIVPKRVEGLTNVTSIGAGGYHSLAVREGYAVYAWGYNDHGQLGLGNHGEVKHFNEPSVRMDVVEMGMVSWVRGVVAVSGGRSHSMALRNDGTVMVCGSGCDGQLGLFEASVYRRSDDRRTFTVVPNLSGVVDIDAGSCHSIAVTCDRELYTWGSGLATGHAGDGDFARCSFPTKVTGGGIDKAVVVQVAAGNSHSLALTATGDLYTWGRGNRGQLGHGENGVGAHLSLPKVVNGIGAVVGMAGAYTHSLVTMVDGRVLSFGKQSGGGLGLGAGAKEALTPTAIVGVIIGGVGEGKEGKE